MRKFIIDIVNIEGSFIFSYDENDVCTDFKSEAKKMNDVQLRWLGTHFPTTVDFLKELYVNSENAKKKFTVTEIVDLSFKAFWDAYEYKEGLKPAQKIWNELNDVEKTGAIAYIKKYNYKLKTTGRFKLMAKTYLNQRTWINEPE